MAQAPVGGTIVGGQSGQGLDTVVRSVMETNYRVSVGILVENWTHFNLDDTRSRVYGGRVSIPPAAIPPAHYNVTAARKTAWAATGTYGTASWLIKGLDRRVFIMWSAPFNFDFYSNVLAVGLSRRGYTDHPEDENFFETMYSGGSTHDINFVRKTYWRHFDSIVCSDDKVEVVGTMGGTHEAVIKITVRPKNMARADLAPGLRDDYPQ